MVGALWCLHHPSVEVTPLIMVTMWNSPSAKRLEYGSGSRYLTASLVAGHVMGGVEHQADERFRRSMRAFRYINGASIGLWSCRGRIRATMAQKSMPHWVGMHQPISRTCVESIDLDVAEKKLLRANASLAWHSCSPKILHVTINLYNIQALRALVV